MFQWHLYVIISLSDRLVTYVAAKSAVTAILLHLQQVTVHHLQFLSCLLTSPLPHITMQSSLAHNGRNVWRITWLRWRDYTLVSTALSNTTVEYQALSNTKWYKAIWQPMAYIKVSARLSHYLHPASSISYFILKNTSFYGQCTELTTIDNTPM